MNFTERAERYAERYLAKRERTCAITKRIGCFFEKLRSVIHNSRIVRAGKKLCDSYMRIHNTVYWVVVIIIVSVLAILGFVLPQVDYFTLLSLIISLTFFISTPHILYKQYISAKKETIKKMQYKLYNDNNYKEIIQHQSWSCLLTDYMIKILRPYSHKHRTIFIYMHMLLHYIFMILFVILVAYIIYFQLFFETVSIYLYYHLISWAVYTTTVLVVSMTFTVLTQCLFPYKRDYKTYEGDSAFCFQFFCISVTIWVFIAILP